MSKKNWIILGCTIAILVIGIMLYLNRAKVSEVQKSVIEGVKKFAADMTKPRGIRNNNPGNLRISNNAWKGKIPKDQNSDGSFEQFSEMKWGVRAMFVLIRNWINKGTATTLRAVVNRYAPANENNTERYIDFVSDRSGIKPDEILSADETTLKKLISAMIIKENGDGHVNDNHINEGWNLT